MRKIFYLLTLTLGSCTALPEISSVNAVKHNDCLIIMIIEYKGHDQALQTVVPSEMICNQSI